MRKTFSPSPAHSKPKLIGMTYGVSPAKAMLTASHFFVMSAIPSFD